MEPSSKNPLSIPLAIVVAGALIAGAVFLTREGAVNPPTQDTTTPQTVTEALTIKPVSASDHTLGNPTAPLSIIVYTDIECPFCKTFHNTMIRVANTYGKDGKVLWVYRHFPLEQLHPNAPKEAEATECASELGGQTAFWNYTNLIFERIPASGGLNLSLLPVIAEEIGLDKTAFSSCLSSGKHAPAVQEDYNEAVDAGGRGTPFSIIVSDKPLSDNAITRVKNATITLPPDTFIYSSDKRRIAMSGALPYTIVEQILNILLENR